MPVHEKPRQKRAKERYYSFLYSFPAGAFTFAAWQKTHSIFLLCANPSYTSPLAFKNSKNPAHPSTTSYSFPAGAFTFAAWQKTHSIFLLCANPSYTSPLAFKNSKNPAHPSTTSFQVSSKFPVYQGSATSRACSGFRIPAAACFQPLSENSIIL